MTIRTRWGALLIILNFSTHLSACGGSTSTEGMASEPRAGEDVTFDPVDPDPADAGPVEMREPCLRPVGSYRTTPGASRASSSAFTCTPPDPTTVFIADVPAEVTETIQGETCTFEKTVYSDDNCERTEVVTCSDGSSIRVECTSDTTADIIECESRQDFGPVVCTTPITYTRTDCPDWAMRDDGTCGQCESDDACSPEQVCHGGACSTPCTSSLDCATGAECNVLGTCAIEPVE